MRKTRNRRLCDESFVNGDRHRPSVRVIPTFVAAGLTRFLETQLFCHSPKIAGGSARHSRFRCCPREGTGRVPGTPQRSFGKRAATLKEPAPWRAAETERAGLSGSLLVAKRVLTARLSLRKWQCQSSVAAGSAHTMEAAAPLLDQAESAWKTRPITRLRSLERA